MNEPPASFSKQQQQFLDHLRLSGNVSEAARQVRIERHVAYRWRQQVTGFELAWCDAIAEATDQLALEARRRALDGVEQINYYRGEPIASIRRYSDQLLMFLLRAYRPATYQPQRQPRNGQDTTADNNHQNKPDQTAIRKAREDIDDKLARLTAEDEP